MLDYNAGEKMQEPCKKLLVELALLISLFIGHQSRSLRLVGPLKDQTNMGIDLNTHWGEDHLHTHRRGPLAHAREII